MKNVQKIPLVSSTVFQLAPSRAGCCVFFIYIETNVYVFKTDEKSSSRNPSMSVYVRESLRLSRYCHIGKQQLDQWSTVLLLLFLCEVRCKEIFRCVLKLALVDTILKH